MKVTCWKCGNSLDGRFEIPRGNNLKHTISVCSSCFIKYKEKAREKRK